MSGHLGEPQVRDALAKLMGLIEQGVLVRDISRDAEPGWAFKMLELVCVLQMAQQALEGKP